MKIIAIVNSHFCQLLINDLFIPAPHIEISEVAFVREQLEQAPIYAESHCRFCSSPQFVMTYRLNAKNSPFPRPL